MPSLLDLMLVNGLASTDLFRRVFNSEHLKERFELYCVGRAGPLLAAGDGDAQGPRNEQADAVLWLKHIYVDEGATARLA